MAYKRWLPIFLATLLLVACAGGLPPGGLPTPEEVPPEVISGGEAGIEGEEPAETGEGELPQPIGGQSEPGEAPPAPEMSLEEIRQEARQSGGFLFYMESPFRAEGYDTYRIPAGGEFSAEVVFGNYEPGESEFLFSCLVDYLQTPCAEGLPGQAYPLTLPSQTDHTFHIRLSDLAEGMHDLIFLIFERPDEHTTNPEFRGESRDLFDFYRVNLYVGESASAPSIAYTSFSEPDEFAPQGMYLYTISREVLLDPWQTPWDSESLNPGQEVGYYATLNNPEPFPTRFALVAFLNFEQVPFAPDHMVFYGQVESQKRASVETSLIAPINPGPYELVVLMVDNPYIDLAKLDLSSDINSSDRVLLTVR